MTLTFAFAHMIVGAEADEGKAAGGFAAKMSKAQREVPRAC
ncbi:MAG: hypothetical protein QOE46_1683 [Acidobacteriota bacterium]|jgi:hypothetical protein|nr:hypothetical protein [Acidobacteriota bacterium]